MPSRTFSCSLVPNNNVFASGFPKPALAPLLWIALLPVCEDTTFVVETSTLEQHKTLDHPNTVNKQNTDQREDLHNVNIHTT